jgi:hypothetical protein
VGLTKVVPFLVEDELKAKGGRFSKTGDWGEWREDKAHLGVILRTVSVWCGAHLMAGFGK